MSHHPHASVLRQRAGHLLELATAIERMLVMDLGEHAESALGTTRRARLCADMLDRNVHQLHQAAEDLRVIAFRFRARADKFDATHHGSVA